MTQELTNQSEMSARIEHLVKACRVVWDRYLIPKSQPLKGVVGTGLQVGKWYLSSQGELIKIRDVIDVENDPDHTRVFCAEGLRFYHSNGAGVGIKTVDGKHDIPPPSDLLVVVGDAEGELSVQRVTDIYDRIFSVCNEFGSLGIKASVDLRLTLSQSDDKEG